MAKDGEIWVSGIHIPEYNQGSWTNHMPRRDRKLLLHRREIAQIAGVIKQGGLTLIPLALYFKDGKAKVEIAVAKGKKAHDKRESLKERQANREVDRELSRHATGKSSSKGKRKKSDQDYD
jgi:SsrA-binding protein